jgi:hypothetical protein
VDAVAVAVDEGHLAHVADRDGAGDRCAEADLAQQAADDECRKKDGRHVPSSSLGPTSSAILGQAAEQVVLTNGAASAPALACPVSWNYWNF